MRNFHFAIIVYIGIVFSLHYIEHSKYDDISFIVQFIDSCDKDSKSFVDKLLVRDFNCVVEDFNRLIAKNNIDINELKADFLERDIDPRNNVTQTFKKDLKMFVENFKKDTSELPSFNVILPERPSWFSELNDGLKHIADRIFELWTVYGRTSGAIDQNKTTKIHLKSKFFVPGGRFQELYYWDSLWILIGLLESDMEDSAFEIIKCFVELINKFGYIPNGTRRYYLGRSQPPVFCQMLDRLYNYTTNVEIRRYILNEGLKAAEIEYEFFMKNKRVPGRFEKEILNMYTVRANKPRPESYKEDLKTLKDNADVSFDFLYSNLWTGAESGWDFSSRWFEDGKTLSKINITNIIPVDINAFMLENERILIKLNKELAEPPVMFDSSLQDRIEKYTRNRMKRWDAMQRILYNPNVGCWNDFNFATDKHNDSRFYFSNIMPLFYSDDFKIGDAEVLRILELYEQPLFGHVGGIPCSGKPSQIIQDRQQWDYPNVWPLHVQMFVEFLKRRRFDNMAYHVARSFINSVKASTHKDKVIFLEKYDCNTIGKKGDGGEYNTQQGFGWTNGTTIYIIRSFGNSLDAHFNHKKSYEEIKEEIRYKQSKYQENEIQSRVDVHNEDILIPSK